MGTIRPLTLALSYRSWTRIHKKKMGSVLRDENHQFKVGARTTAKQKKKMHYLLELIIFIMSESPVIQLSSDEEEEDEIEEIEFRNATQKLIDNPSQSEENRSAKKLSDIQCPICFDDITDATTTSCGHIFCLECIEQSISSSHARGQVRNAARGKGLCPLCRKEVTFKETIVIRAKKAKKVGMPELPAQ